MESPAVSARLIGAIFVERGLISQEALDDALAEQEATGAMLGEILVAKHGVSRLALAGAIAEQWADLERPGPEEGEGEAGGIESVPNLVRPAFDQGERRPLGEIFVEQGMITEEELEEALRVQQQSGDRLGEILVARGAISRLELASALADQWSSLQKLRPPEAPPSGQVAAPGDETQRDSSTGPDPRLDFLVEKVAELERRDDAELRHQLSLRFDALSAALAETEARLRETLQGVETARAEGARRLGELAGEMPPLAAEVEALRGRAEQLEQRGDEELRARFAELSARIEELASPRPDPELAGAVGSLAARLEAVEGRSDEEFRVRLAAVEGRSDEELRAELADLRERLAELAARPLPDPGFTEELHTRLEAIEARSDEDVRRRVDELAQTLDGLAGRAVPDRGEFEELRVKLQEVEARSHDEIRARLEALEARSDTELRERLDDLARRLDGLFEHAAEDPGVPDELLARLAAVEGRNDEDLRAELAGLRDRLAEVSAQFQAVGGRMETLEGRSDEGVRRELAEIWDRLAELAARELPDPGFVAELGARLDELGRGGESVREELVDIREQLGGLAARPVADPGLAPAVEALAGRLEAVEARSDEEIRARLEAVEARSDEELRARVEELGGRVDEVRTGEGEARAALDDAIRRVGELERVVLRFDEVDRRLGELGDSRSKNEATVALWRAVDVLRGRAEQALALLGQAGSRLDDLEAATRLPREATPKHGPSARVAPPPASPAPAATEHVLFAPNGNGYELVSRDGAPPSTGQWIELPDREERLLVARLGRSPLPGDRRPCVFLETAVGSGLRSDPE